MEDLNSEHLHYQQKREKKKKKVCLKTENCCLKIFVEIRVDEKVY